MQTSTRQSGAWILGVILVLAAGVRVAQMDRPFHRDGEGISAFYGVLARSYFHRGFDQTHGLPAINNGRTNPVAFYSNHPPLVPWLAATTYGLFGFRHDSDWVPAPWQLRLVPSLFLLGSTWLVYRMVLPRASMTAALLSAGLFAFAPISVLFGGHADVISPQLVFFTLLSTAAYLNFFDSPGWRRLLLLCAAFLPAGLTDWPAYMLVVVFCGHYLLMRRRRKLWWIVPFGLFGVLEFFACYAWIATTIHNWDWMRSLVKHRSFGGVSESKGSYDAIEWLHHALWEYGVGMIGHVAVPLALIWLLRAIWVKLQEREQPEPITPLVVVLLAFGYMHVIIGMQGVYQHPWWWWPLLPGTAIAAGVVLAAWCTTTARWSVVALLLAAHVAGAVWHTADFLKGPHGIYLDEASHTTQEIGDVIRASCPPDQLAAIADHDLTSTGVWYYADRPILFDVWLPEQITDMRAGKVPNADTPFGYKEKWGKPPAIAVVPKCYDDVTGAYRAWLAESFERVSPNTAGADKFHVFDLTKPRKSH